jgi:hypothetical protein
MCAGDSAAVSPWTGLLGSSPRSAGTQPRSRSETWSKAVATTPASRNPAGIPFRDLERVCREKCGAPRQRGRPHMFFAVPWTRKPLVNIQDRHGVAVEYQVRQVLLATDRL